MYRLDPDKRAGVVAALVEGNSIRATARITKVDRNTITSLLVDLGTACAEFQDKALHDLPCRRIQCDEIWAFCYAKDKNVPLDKKDQFGFGSIRQLLTDRLPVPPGPQEYDPSDTSIPAIVRQIEKFKSTL